MAEQRGVVAAVRVVECEYGEHPRLLRHFVGAVVGQAIVPDVVIELVVDEALRVCDDRNGTAATTGAVASKRVRSS